MIFLNRIASYIPTRRLDVREIGQSFGFKDDFIEKQLGFRSLARKEPGEETSGLCLKAFDALAQTGLVSPQDVDFICVCTQNPDGSGLPHVSAILHGLIGAPAGCAAFDIGLGCSGYVYGLSVATSFMQANGLRCGLLFTADPYSKVVDPADRGTAALFGDAATVSLLTPDAQRGGYRPYGFKFFTDGTRGRALHAEQGRLHMDGRDVFMFAAKQVPELFQALLRDNGLTLDTLDLILLHPGSRYIVDTLIERLGLPRDKTPFTAQDYGNTVSSSIPLLFEPLFEGNVEKGVMCGFGVGLSAALCAFERIGKGAARA